MTQLRMKRVRVTKFHIPDTPINDRPLHAITDDDGGFAKKADLERALFHALAGVELGTQDVAILSWLAGWEPDTVAVICSWMERARAQEREACGG